MANQAFPSVNEDECSWADIEATINVPGGRQLPLIDLEGIKWGRTLTRGISKGTSGGRPMKKTAGSLEVEGSLVTSRSGHAAMMEALEAAAEELGLVRGDEVIISGVRFDILIQHTPLGSSRIYTAKLTGCSFDGDSSDMAQGESPDTLEVALNPLQVATKSASGKWIVLR